MKDLGELRYFLGIEVIRKKIVGSLIYLTITSADLNYTVGLESQFM